MFVGNLLALAQKNIKRLLAYSSIAQAGYILIGVAANSALGTSSAVYYLMAYLVTNLAAFGIVTIVGKTVGSDEISAYAGLSRRSPGLALALLVCMLSLGGIPPFAGFFGKVLGVWRSRPVGVGLAGAAGLHQLDDRPLLLPDGAESDLPAPLGRRYQAGGHAGHLEGGPDRVHRRRGRAGDDLRSLVWGGQLGGGFAVLMAF